MKTFILFLACCSMYLGAFSQPPTRDGAVPEMVLQNFQKEFPQARLLNWDRSGNSFVARFVLNGFNERAYFSTAGIWLYTDIDIPTAKTDKIPEKAMNHFKSSYPGYRILNAGYRDAPSGSYYYLEVTRGGERRTLRYDDFGKYLLN
ncbi:MAG: hypothetical protein AAFR59_03730 [Bacteroidota bacterium]